MIFLKWNYWLKMCNRRMWLWLCPLFWPFCGCNPAYSTGALINTLFTAQRVWVTHSVLSFDVGTLDLLLLRHVLSNRCYSKRKQADKCVTVQVHLLLLNLKICWCLHFQWHPFSVCLNSTEVPYSLVNKGGQHKYVLVQYRLLTQSVWLCIQCTYDGTMPTVYTEKNYDCVCIIDNVVLMGHLLQIIDFLFLYISVMTWVSIHPFGSLAPFCLYSLVASLMVHVSVSLSLSALYKLKKNWAVQVSTLWGCQEHNVLYICMVLTV